MVAKAIRRSLATLKWFFINRSWHLLVRMAEDSRVFFTIVRWFVKVFPGLSLLPLKPYGAGATSVLASLTEACPSVSVTPKELGLPGRRFASVFPPILARNFHAPVIRCDSSAIVLGTDILMPEHYSDNRERIRGTGGHLRITHGQLGVIDTREPKRLAAGIGLVGLGSFNWYHWLIEILPAAMLAKDLPEAFREYPLLVPEEYEKYESFRDSLAVFQAGRSVIPLKRKKQYQVDDLILIDSPVHGPFNMRHGLWPKVTDYQQNATVLTAFRDTILDALAITPSPPEAMIFLARDNIRRSYNQGELVEIALSCGFTVIYPERLSFREQVKVFHSARCIVGSSGGAWANTLFCQSGAQGLTWTFPEYREFCAFSNLAMISGLELSYMFSASQSKLTSTGAAYNMPYRVDPEVFSHNLASLMLRN